MPPRTPQQLNGIEMLESVRLKRVAAAQREGDQLPGIIVGVFGITPVKRESQYNPFMIVWTVSPHRKDMRHGAVNDPQPLGEYAKSLLKQATPWRYWE